MGNQIAETIAPKDRKSTRLNSSHTVIYTLSLHDALPISRASIICRLASSPGALVAPAQQEGDGKPDRRDDRPERSEEHTSELQSHRDLHSFPTRRSSDLSRLDHLPASELPGRSRSACPAGRRWETRSPRRSPRRSPGPPPRRAARRGSPTRS